MVAFYPMRMQVKQLVEASIIIKSMYCIDFIILNHITQKSRSLNLIIINLIQKPFQEPQEL